MIAIVKGCQYKRKSRPSNRRAFTTCRPNYRRDQTIIKFLLDTGLRASEFVSLRLGDVDLVTGRDILETLDELMQEYGKPRYIRSDNGSEFIAEELRE